MLVLTKDPITMRVLLMFYVFTMLSTKSWCVTYQEVESIFLSANNFWDFDQTPLNQIKDRKSGRLAKLNGRVVRSPSPVNNGIYLDECESSWVDLDMTASWSSCLRDPFSCTEGLTVAMLIKATNKYMPKGRENEVIQSEVFGPYGNVSEVNRPGVRVLYRQPDNKMSVHIIGQTEQCQSIFDWSRNRWVFLVITWSPSAANRKLNVYRDGNRVNYQCLTKRSGETAQNKYKLGYEFYPAAWYDMLAIWDRVVPVDDLKILNDFIKDNGGKTEIFLSLKLPGIIWHEEYRRSSTLKYKYLEEKLINNVTFTDGMNGQKYFNGTQLLSFEKITTNFTENVKANLKINFAALMHETAIELQEILDNMVIGGKSTQLVKCSSDDNFFCRIPTNIKVSRTINPSMLQVTWTTFTEEFPHNGYYKQHRFTYNISSTQNRTSVWIDTPTRGKAWIGGLQPYTHYCIRVAAESFKASGFFSEPECDRTIQSKPSIPPIILSAYNTSHVSMFVKWNQTIPREGWNGIPIGYYVNWGTGEAYFGLSDSFYHITTGLKPYRMYTIKVSGRTSVGPGKSNSVQVRTSEWYPYNYPQNITISGTSQTSIKVTWSNISFNDRNGIIRGYRIELFDMDFGSLVESITVPPTVREREYYNLSIYNTYGVQIRGFTVVGDGPNNNLSLTVAKTEESVPIVAPVNLHGYNLSANSIVVQWYFDSYVRNVLGVLLGFRIFLNAADMDPHFSPSVTEVKGEVNSTVINNLWPFTRYSLSIAAFTRIGHGVVSQPLLVRTDGKAPGQPPSPITAYNVSSTSIKVHWGKVDKHHHHGILLGYKIILSESLRPLETIIRPMPIESNTTLFTGLRIYTRYIIRVLAFNKYGDGQYSMITTITDEEPPSRPPTFVKAWNASSTSILVTWRPINDSYYEHGALLGYQLTYHRVDGRGWVKTVTDSTNTLTTIRTGLEKYVEYSITVQAFNSKGIGPASQPVICSTDEDVPSTRPVNLRGFNTSKTSIFVMWDPAPAEGSNGVLLGYYLMYNITNSPSLQSSRKRRSIITSSFITALKLEQGNHTLRGLYPYTLYSIGIAAYTSKGAGLWSSAVLIRTNDEEPQIPPPLVTAHNSSSTSINVTWIAIPKEQVAGILRSYMIKYIELDRQGNNVSLQLISVPVTQLTLELTNLTKFTNYIITVRGVTVDLGVESTPIIIRTSEDTPSKAPQNITVLQSSYRSLNVSWDHIPTPFVHGTLRGMVLFYKKTKEFATELNKTVTLQPNKTSYYVNNLEPYTNYSFWMFGFTTIGYGVASRVYVGLTDEYVPSKSPVNLTALNFTSHNSINVSWNPIPHGFVHGILRGYRILYEKVRLEDKDWDGIQVNYTVEPQLLSTMIEGLDNYAVYSIRVLGFTVKGDGAISQSIYVETCRCAKKLTTSWSIVDPYVTHNQSTSATLGLLPFILEPMVTLCCGNCYNGHGQTDIDFHHDGQGNVAEKSNITKLLVTGTDLTFPVYGFDGKTTHGDNGYVGLVTSPGVAFITPIQKMTSEMFKATMNSWPLIAMMFVIIFLAGILTWALDSKQNPEHFPRPFIEGTIEGCWLAFISITTVGYGDRAPKSFLARVISIANMLCGFVLISLITANLSSDFVVTTVMADKKSLFLTKVGAITHSFEYNIAIRRNALINTESEYYTYNELRGALISGEVQGVLLDMYVATAHQEFFTLPSGHAKISQLLPYGNVYGVVLGGRTNKLHKCFNDFLKFKKNEVSNVIEGTLSKLSMSEGSLAEEMTSTILDPSSIYFRYLYKYTGLALLAAFMFGLAYTMLHVIRRKSAKYADTLQSELREKTEKIQELKKMIEDFYENFTKRFDSMKRRHKRERLRFYQMKIKSPKT